MSMTVWEYEWPLQPARDRMSFDMPKGAEILTAREQGASVCIWARVDPNAEKVRRRFALCGNGHGAPEIDPDSEQFGRYIGTAHLYNGTLVLHIFEGRSE